MNENQYQFFQMFTGESVDGSSLFSFDDKDLSEKLLTGMKR